MKGLSLNLLAVLVVCGCGGDQTERAAGYVVKDSAGVRIVENTSPSWPDGDEWILSEQPVVDIGGDNRGSSGHLFQVTDAVRLPDGRIVVVNIGSQELRFYSSDEPYLAAAGGKGGGPGEFASLAHLWLLGDSLVAFDEFPPRLVVFDLEGQYLRAVRLEPTTESEAPYVQGIFSDGSALVRGFGERTQRPKGRYRNALMWVRYNPEGHMSNTLGTFPGREYWGAEAHGTILPMAFLLGRSTTVIAHGLHLYVADSDTYEIRIYYVDGALKSIVRRRHEPLGVTRADVDAVIAGSQPEREQVLRQQSAPATMPAFGWNDSRLAAAIHVDDSDNLWVKEYDRPTERRYRWSVFDSGGQWLGIVDFAGAVEPKHIGD